MTKSSLATVSVLADSSNYNQGRNGKTICKFTPHHAAGVLTALQLGKIFQNPARNASATYCIGNDGTIACTLDEANRPWTSSSPDNDYQAITVEVSNSGTGGDWPISDAAWNSLIELAVDVCKRYNFRLEFDGTSNGSLTYHEMFKNTNCPGPMLKSKMNELATIVNARLDNNEEPVKPVIVEQTTKYNVGDKVKINGVYLASNSTTKLTPKVTEGTITRRIIGALNPYLLNDGNIGWVNDNVIEEGIVVTVEAKKSIDEIAQEVIQGRWGTQSSKPSRQQRLEEAGYNYEQVRARVNELVLGKPISNAPAKKSNEEIAREVINGKWDVQPRRQKLLEAAGYNYEAIRAIVNKLAK